MPAATLDGVTLRYEEVGSGEPVVLIHGAFIVDAFRLLVREPILAGSYRLITYARRGYGGSGPAGVASVGQHAADCRALMVHLGLERAHVVGHSLGGSIGLQLALDAAGVVASLAVLEPGLIVGDSAQSYRDSLQATVERARRMGAAEAVDSFTEARWPGYRPLLDQLIPGAFEQAVADAPACLDGDIPGLLRWQFGESEARRISSPVLAVLGGGSVALAPRFEEAHELLLSWLPDAEGVVLPGLMHLLQIEDPRATAQVLAGFLARHAMGDAG